MDLVFHGVAVAQVGDPDLIAGLADALDAAFALLQAGGGELGFGKPQICVEVKSGSDPVDRLTVDKLIGAVKKFGA